VSVPEPTCLLIADISGYTSYLAGVELDHAQDILADLMGTVVTSLRPTFRLAKLEGDAAFTFAPAEQVDGSLLLDTIERCYFGFRRRRRDVRQATSCECNACIRIPDLNLKFVVHVGSVARQKMAGLEELVGSDVIVVHRLLKNTIVETTGIAAYAMFSQACIDATGLEADALGMTRHLESYDYLGEVPSWVLDLEGRWVEEDARARVIVEPAAAVLDVPMPTNAPPQTVWEFLTTPGRRVAWSSATGVTAVIVEAPGNRRGVGATNHCMHGKDVIVEEILDWRPFDYFTIRSTMQTPAGQIRFVTTFDLEPTTDGTVVHMRFGAPASKKERAIFAQVGATFGPLFAANAEALRAQLDAALSERAAGVPAEPDLPAPSPDSPFAGVQPLQMAG
jgi:uncharacterized protein YndB with AHSA1/START domain